ncbi:MAG TPA: hypothetical protein VHD60_03975 [Candidatus Saccharimonadales bacterium]|nr:hypothetical protein [Candidatus Saccharimonadales bacterium]
MSEDEIRLERNPSGHGAEILVGIADEATIDDRMVTAVQRHRRAFGYIVDAVATNRLQQMYPDVSLKPYEPPTPELLAIKGLVRDELLAALGGVALPQLEKT